MSDTTEIAASRGPTTNVPPEASSDNPTSQSSSKAVPVGQSSGVADGESAPGDIPRGSSSDAPKQRPKFEELAKMARISRSGEVCMGFGGRCQSKLVQGPSDILCGICFKLDLTVLKELYNRNADEEKMIRVMFGGRMFVSKAAESQGFLPCALENLKWDGKPWRLAFKPQSIHHCQPVRTPGADEGCFCETCVSYEMEAEENREYFLPVSPTNPYARVKFTCIWKDPKWANAAFRSCIARNWECPDDSPTKVPASMCQYCSEKFRSLRPHPETIDNLFDSNYRLIEAYPKQLPILTVPETSRSSNQATSAPEYSIAI